MTFILMVEDDEAVLRGMKRLLPSEWHVRTAGSASAAHKQLAMCADWAGFLLDVGLSDGRYGGLELLRRVRATWPLVPAALVTATLERDVINEAATLGATMIAKPLGAPQIAGFLRRAGEALHASARARHVATLAKEKFELTAGEASIVWWVAAGNRADTYATHSGMGFELVAPLVTRLLAKAGAPDVATIVVRLLCHTATSRVEARDSRNLG